ncbi:MAG: ATP-binding protein [Flavobacteriaceae bacterium]|nr:ATP-binding protein [Flavobacteriaceae bacterium]
MKMYKLESTLYNPQEKSKEDLICDFVIRNNEFNTIFKEINSADIDLPKQHYLIVGQRGMGKTTLMMRLRYAIEDSKTLKNTIPITLKEEHYAIHKLSDLWTQIAEQLEDYHSFDAVLETFEKVTYHEEEYANDTYRVLEQKLQEKNKQLVLFVDNFNDLLEKFSKQDVYVLRDILMNKPSIRLVASNPTLTIDITDYQKPLYEFFKQFQLKALKQKEVITLLQTLAERHQAQERIEEIIKNSPERINTLRILSGGVPRTIAMLFNIFVEEQTQSTIQDLYKLLDEVTPLYKHRMDDLKPNQQKIVYEVAMNWDGISVKELAEKAKMESKTVSAQLNLLSKNQIIEKIPTETKNNFYRLQERFLNIWYLMRLGNKRQHDRVVWLVRFLDNWCNEDEMQRRVNLFLKDQEIAKNIKELLNEVYLKSEKVPIESKQEILAKYGDEISFVEKIKYMKTEDFPYNEMELYFNNDIEKFFELYQLLLNSFRYDIIEEIQEKIDLKMMITNNTTKLLVGTSLVYLSKYNKLIEFQDGLKTTFITEYFDKILERDSQIKFIVKIDPVMNSYESVRTMLLFLGNNKKNLPLPTISYYANKLKLLEKINIYYELQPNSSILKAKAFFKEKSFSEIYAKIQEKAELKNFEIIAAFKVKKLLSKEKYFIAQKFIEEMELKEILKPYYYVTQHFLGNTQEVKRMGAELQEAFNRIIKDVLQEQEKKQI